MARIEGLGAKRAGLLARFAYWYSRRSLGKVPEPLKPPRLHLAALGSVVGLIRSF